MPPKFYHKELADGRWRKFNFLEQMANIGSEVERAMAWRKKNSHYSESAFFRALELVDFTLGDPENNRGGWLKELCRLREILVDYFFGDNKYGSSDKLWHKYFFAFSWAARLRK